MSFYLSGGVEVLGFISPTEITDEYPVIDPLYGIDGLRNVNLLSDLNNIPTPRRRPGMLVGVSGGTQYYKLNSPPWNNTISDWSIFNSGGGSFTGGTVTGNTIFTQGLTATTFSASTYQNLPQDIFVTGGTYTNGEILFKNNSGGSFTVTGLPIGGAGGEVYYLNLSQTQTPYQEFSPIGTNLTEQTTGVTINSGVTSTIASFLTPVGYPNTTTIPAGYWSFYLHSYKDVVNASFGIFCEVYVYTTGGTETLILTTESADVTTYSPTVSMELTDGYYSGGTIDITDRILVKIRTTNNGSQTNTLSFFTEGQQHYSYGITPFSDFNTLTCETLSGCTTIFNLENNKVNKSGDTMTGTLYVPTISATTISGGTLYGDGSNLTGLSSGLNVGTTQITNGTSGRVLFQSGTTLQQDGSLFWDITNGRLSIGQGSSPGARLDIRAQGTLSTDIAFRIRNSGDTADLISFRGDGSQWIQSVPFIHAGNLTGGVNVNQSLYLGYNSTSLSSIGTRNVIIGTGGGGTANGNNNVSIGYNTSFGSFNSSIIIGSGAVVSNNNSCVMGSELVPFTSMLIGTGAFVQSAANVQNMNLIVPGVAGGFTSNTSAAAKFFKLSAQNGSGNGEGAPIQFATAPSGTAGFTANANVVFLEVRGDGMGLNHYQLSTPRIPSSNITDGYIQYSADRGGVAGKASVHFRSEDGTINVLGDLSGIGTSSPQARLDVRAQGALSTDIAFRVRNSGDDRNIFAVLGNGDIEVRTNRVSLSQSTRLSIGGSNSDNAPDSSGYAENTIVGFNNTNLGLRSTVIGSSNSSSNSNTPGTILGYGNSIGANGISIGHNNTYSGIVLGSSNTGGSVGRGVIIGDSNIVSTPSGNPTAPIFLLGNGVSIPNNSAANNCVFLSAGNNSTAPFNTFKNDNLLIGSLTPWTSNFDNNSRGVFYTRNGTAPTTLAADTFALYSADRGGTAGRASAHFRSEDGTINVLGDRTGINTSTPQARFHVANADTTLTTGLFSGSGQNILTIIGSGSTQPLFTVQGSSGELFSITDSLVGSLFSVNDISGLPIFEVFSDNTTLMGSYLAPSLNTTSRVLATTGTTNVYSIPTSAYTGAFFDYTVSDGTNLRAGNIMSIWSGTSVNITETQTTDFGNTSGLTFNMVVSSGNAILRTSGVTGNWTVKTIVRGI